MTTMLTFTTPLSRGHAALRGLLALVLGGTFLVWPGITIGTAVVLFAIFCFMDAFIALARLFSSGRSAGDRVLTILRTLIDVAAAIVAIAYPGPTAEVLTVIIGVYVIVLGVIEIAASSTLSKLGSGGGWLVVSGLLSIVAGIVLIVWPDIGAVSLAIVFGAYLAAYGIWMLASAAVAPKGSTASAPQICPVMEAEASSARKRTTRATSSGRPARRTGIAAPGGRSAAPSWRCCTAHAVRAGAGRCGGRAQVHARDADGVRVPRGARAEDQLAPGLEAHAELLGERDHGAADRCRATLGDRPAVAVRGRAERDSDGRRTSAPRCPSPCRSGRPSLRDRSCAIAVQVPSSAAAELTVVATITVPKT